MSKKIRFCTLYLPCSNVELAKDVGQIPYTLSSLYNWDCSVAGCNINQDKLENKELLNKISIYNVKKVVNKEITGILFLLKNARKIDCINFYHGGRTVLYWSKLYHFLNPKGKVYLKLDMDFRLCDKYDNNQKERSIFRKTVESVDIVTVESSAIRNRIQKYTDKKIELLSNGYQKIEKFTDLKKDNCFITVGRLGTKQKATEILLEAFSMSAPYHNWNLKLIGSVEESFKDYLRNFYKENPELEQRIIFMGEIKNRNELYEEYCKSRVFVLPSMWESFGLVVGEALSCGCRVIVSDKVPPMEEFTNNHKYGEVVKAGDIKELAKAMVDETYRNYDKIENEEIIQYARAKFSWEEICKTLYGLIMENGKDTI